MNTTSQEIPGATQPISPLPDANFGVKPASGFSRKRLVIGISILVVFLLISLGFYYSTRKQVVVDTLLVSVGENNIYKSTVEKAAAEQYTPSAISQDVLKKFLDVTIERSVLDIEAKKINIVISEDDIDKELQKSGFGSSNRNIIRYKLLKEKIQKKLITSREVYMVSFWIPDLTYPQKPIYKQQRLDAEKALTEIESRMISGEEPIAIARSISDKYPSLQSIIAVNGYFIENKLDDNLFSSPVFYTSENFSKDMEIYSSIFQSSTGEIKKFVNKNFGGTVFKIISANDLQYPSYDLWYLAQQKSLVTVHTQL